uniref:MADS-box domain-containing protein n=1 Tax=Kalanchoe fedtschenkoi TaxID=63787 RepID=A0A7N0TN27_KALFE
MASSSDQVSNPPVTTSTITSLTVAVSASSPTDAVPVAPSDAMPPPPAPVAPSDAPAPPSDEAPPSSSGVKRGRGKIRMRKMEKETNRLVTFSKRKSGLFKKANELCTLCGVECALVVFSPAEKVFSFGIPSVNDVMDRYLSGNPPNPDPSQPPQPAPVQVPQNTEDGQNQGQADTLIKKLSDELSNLTDALEASRQNGLTLDKMREERKAAHWVAIPVSDMGGRQLDALKKGLSDLKGIVCSIAEQLFQASASMSSVPAPFSFQGAGPPPSGGFPGGPSNYEPDEAGPSGGFPGGPSNYGPDEAGPSGGFPGGPSDYGPNEAGPSGGASGGGFGF